MKILQSKRVKIAVAVAAVLVLFIVRPGVGRLRARIVQSISLALGRQVEVAAVNLRLLPQPGFDLENFVVHDDPAFSAEPVLRASQVTASLRVSSLLRGRLEIARLSLTEPSLNLVRNQAGHWNVESLLERSAHTAVAPTSKARGETRPGFPYIEADDGRINFKIRQEKKPYALTGADFSLWQDSENSWGMRLRAQPVRTDFNLSDTGNLRVEGTWQRAATLRKTPLQFSLLWDDGQLGQVTKLASGTDKGWRGSVQVSATLTGTPKNLAVKASGSVDGFRRYDILSGSDFPLTAQCSGTYSSVDRTLSDLSCKTPVGGGAITLAGRIGGWETSPTYDLALDLRQVPLQSLAALASHAKKNIPEDLAVSGKVDGDFHFLRAITPRTIEEAWKGKGEARGLRLGSPRNRTGIVLDQIAFAVSPASTSRHGSANAVPRVEIGPVKLDLGKSGPAVVAGWLSDAGYHVQIQGPAELQRLLALTRTVGLPTPQSAADGAVKVDLHIEGTWSAFATPRAVGTVQLRGIRAAVRGLNEPLEIASANLLLSQHEVQVNKILASFAGGAWRGSMAWPRPCLPLTECPIAFDLHTDRLATDDLGRAIRPVPGKRPWYRIFSASPEPGIPFLAALHATGTLHASRVVIHKMVATQVSAAVLLEKGKLRLSDVDGDLFGGTHSGEWKADFTVRPPQYSGTGTLDGITLGEVAQAMHDGWVTGTAGATYQVSATGWNVGEMLASAHATVDVSATDGTLPHISLVAHAAPLFVRHFTGQLLLRNGTFDIQQGKLATANGIYQVSGTASLGQALNIKLMRDPLHGFNITGTVAEPRVAETANAETRAALKP